MTFPSVHLVPREETTASAFIKEYPDYNGKNVTIGVLDTGVDPGAIGLQKLPDGSRKIIHMVDCTGSGDVAMSKDTMAVFKKGEGWVIEKGLFGNPVVLNPALTLNPFPCKFKNEEKVADEKEENKAEGSSSTEEDGEISMPVRLGFKRAYELFPRKLTARVKKHYKEIFDKEQRKHANPVRSELLSWKTRFADGSPTRKDIQEKEDLEAKLRILEGDFDNNDPLLEDPGPLYQIVLFYDGENYRVLLDTMCEGDLSKIPTDMAMTDYHKEGQYGTFSSVDMCNYAVNVYEEGKLVSIVVDAGAHGSHVAGICARFGGASDLANGVAPGANIVSLKIGDTRLGSMETGTALTRALIEAVRHKCDVINLSYGEGCKSPNTGRFIKLAEDLVNKHGIIFVASAGNNGPALTTVGAPGGTSEAILGVAAYVSPQMMEAEYSMCVNNGESDDESIDDVQGTTYTWSSVGPATNGATGVDITAPGAAITCVANWCLQRNQLMNGTSMSSPNATGCIALLISAAKSEGMKISPARIKQALRNTASFIEGFSCLQQGCGMIQVQKAWDYLKANKDDEFEDVTYGITILGRPETSKGVYLRQRDEVSVKQTFSVNINPEISTVEDVSFDAQNLRINYEMKFRLESNASWVKVPNYFILMHNGRSFQFEVDPTNLQAGVHTAKIVGYDTNKPAKGPQFTVPITVTVPLEESPAIDLGELEFGPNEVKRFFLSVPPGATWMDVTVKDCRNKINQTDSSSRLLVLHSIQLLPHQAYRDNEEHAYLRMLPSQETVTSISVFPGITCELDLARFWSAKGTTRMKVYVQFRGVTTLNGGLSMLSGRGGASATILSPLRDEFVLPKAKLHTWRRPLNPIGEGLISPCDKRDILLTGEKQIHQLILTYEFDQQEAGKIKPVVPALQGVLYESEFESQLIQIFDEDKKLLGVVDSWPNEVDVPKGKLTLRLQIRHDSLLLLDESKQMSIFIEKKLDKNISLQAHSSHESMMKRNPIRRRLLRKGTHAHVVFSEPDADMLPSGSKCGDILFGNATFVDTTSTLPSKGHYLSETKLTYVLKDSLDVSNNDHSSAKEPELPDERSFGEKMEEKILKLKVDEIKNMSDDAEFEAFYEELAKENPKHLPLLLAGLKYFDKEDKRKEKLDKVIGLANQILSIIDENDLSLHFGAEYDKEDAKSCKERKEMNDKKEALVIALARKARALLENESSSQCSEIANSDTFALTCKQLEKWKNVESDDKFAVLALEKEKRSGCKGLMLRRLSTLLAGKGLNTKDGICPLTKGDIIERRLCLLKDMGYMHLAEREKAWMDCSAKEFALF